MTAERKAIFYRRWNKFIGWSDILTVILLAMLAMHALAQSGATQAQTETMEKNTRAVSKLEAEVSDLQVQLVAHNAQMLAMNVEGRLARLEAAQEINKELLIGISIALALMLIETAQRRLSKGK